MPVFATREAWLERAAFLRKQILASAGLLPMPEKRPLNAQVFGKLERDGYTVEKVLLETLPGFYLGGNLYRPRGRQGPFPGVVSPHGHWHYGRLENTALVSVPGRAITLARQGYVVFSYDMVGQNDTNQVPHDWLDARQDLWNIGSSMGIHLWNSIRATDFLTSLPDVDPNRIVATGASGGGTQTFFLMAVDDRIKAAAPVNMISATSQGGGCQARCQPARGLDRLQQHGRGRPDGAQAADARFERRRLDRRNAQGSISRHSEHLPAARRGKQCDERSLSRSSSTTTTRKAARRSINSSTSTF